MMLTLSIHSKTLHPHTQHQKRKNTDHMLNLTGYFENDLFGARLMYNYRTEWYDGVTDFGSEQFTDDFGQWDASVTYHLMENVDIKFEAVNITDEEISKYHQDPSRLSKVYKNGRRFVLGANVRF